MFLVTELVVCGTQSCSNVSLVQIVCADNAKYWLIKILLSMMVCLYWQIPRRRPIKNGLYRIVWKCSYCSKTETGTKYHSIHILSVSVSSSVNEPLGSPYFLIFLKM